MIRRALPLVASCWLAGCYTAPPVGEPAPAGVVFTYPADGQLDVPLGARLVVSFAGAVAADTSVQVVGPRGAVEISTSVGGGGKTLAITSSVFEPGTSYEILLPTLEAPLLRFTTRSDQPRSGPPVLIALNGSDPLTPGAHRPILDTSTLQLVFSEPLDPRTIAPDTIALFDAAGAPVPATLLFNGIHAALDPHAPLSGTYELRLSEQLLDLGGEPLAATTVTFAPTDSLGRGAIRQVFRTREPADPNAAIARMDSVNVMEIAHPLIGSSTASMRPGVLETELGDPTALGGPISFRIPKGQRLSSSGLAVALSGTIPSGLDTGDIWIELVADGGGRLHRNPRAVDTIPDNERLPVQVDLSLDLAVYATNPTGTATLAQTVLGVQLTGLAIADQGALAIETLGALDIALLGISAAPTNIVLDLISAPDASPQRDTEAPLLLGSLPAEGLRDLSTEDGIELVFDEPIDLERARAGGITLRDAAGTIVASGIELHGSVVVVRPRADLLGDHDYTVELTDVADAAGNAAEPATFAIATRTLAHATPPSIVAIDPGAPCALVEATDADAGRCAGGAAADDRYRPFALAANEKIAVVFDQPMLGSSLTLGTTCGIGSVRIEHVDAAGTCLEPVAGTLVKRQRELAFVPDRPWRTGERYVLRLFSGLNANCEPGDICGANNRPANFNPLAGMTAGGPELVVPFVGGGMTTATTMLVGTSEGASNRVALRIADTSGLIQAAELTGEDCIPETPEPEACMSMLGSIPARLGERRDNCTLPDGTVAERCIPVLMSPQAMYSSGVAMRAGALGIMLDADTGTNVMRIRESPDRPLEGYLIERDGGAVMVVALELYMDAPGMSLPLAQHDMHSKPLSVALEGPLTFLPDGRIALTLHNVAELPISVGITAPLGIEGAVHLIVPAGEMKLQLVSRSQRGSLP